MNRIAITTTSPARRWALALAVPTFAALWLVACGPGIGGTGTDSVAGAFVAYDARPAPVCDSPLAAGLDCVAAAPTGAGTTAVNYIDPAPSARHLAVYVGNTVTLDDRCSGARFVGEWGRRPDGRESFFGVHIAAGGGAQQAAELKVGSDGNARQTVELRAFDGAVLIAPRVLHRTAPPLLSPVCS
jgi:hypothetical protein